MKNSGLLDTDSRSLASCGVPASAAYSLLESFAAVFGVNGLTRVDSTAGNAHISGGNAPP